MDRSSETKDRNKNSRSVSWLSVPDGSSSDLVSAGLRGVAAPKGPKTFAWAHGNFWRILSSQGPWIGFGFQGCDQCIAAGTGASRLGFGSRDRDLDLETNLGYDAMLRFGSQG